MSAWEPRLYAKGVLYGVPLIALLFLVALVSGTDAVAIPGFGASLFAGAAALFS
ncbi:hypothetical protein [Haloarchaeobius salinus]|uniref:hypothetical protein n=1 Tax=Haloarchaeobius salinus TaxID=1198298 RepID=UPI00210BBAD9|nr:hypothetical protein [Haloarchaeobius salinus]